MGNVELPPHLLRDPPWLWKCVGRGGGGGMQWIRPTIDPPSSAVALGSSTAHTHVSAS